MNNMNNITKKIKGFSIVSINFEREDDETVAIYGDGQQARKEGKAFCKVVTIYKNNNLEIEGDNFNFKNHGSATVSEQNLYHINRINGNWIFPTLPKTTT